MTWNNYMKNIKEVTMQEFNNQNNKIIERNLLEAGENYFPNVLYDLLDYQRSVRIKDIVEVL